MDEKIDRNKKHLLIGAIAKHCGCSNGTIIRYTDEGIAEKTLDWRGRRIFSLSDRDKLKQVWDARNPKL